MRSVVLLLLMLSLAGTATASITSNLSPKPKPTLSPYVNPPERIPGDTVGDPFFLPEVPVTVTGTTTGLTHDNETDVTDETLSPPPLECPPGALLEAEDNGGCGSNPVVFQPLNPQAGGCATMCGTAWADASSRDTDWFVSIGAGSEMTGTAVGEFPLQYVLIYGADCADLQFLWATGDPGVPVTLSYLIANGAEVWNWIGSSAFETSPESDYVLSICGIKNPPPPPGACCRNGDCLVMDPEACLFAGGTFIGADVPCDPDPCGTSSVPEAAGPTNQTRSWGQLKWIYR